MGHTLGIIGGECFGYLVVPISVHHCQLTNAFAVRSQHDTNCLAGDIPSKCVQQVLLAECRKRLDSTSGRGPDGIGIWYHMEAEPHTALEILETVSLASLSFYWSVEFEH